MKIIKLDIEENIHNADDFEKRLYEIMERESEVVLDFAGVKDMDFTVVKMIMRNSMRFRERGNVTRFRNMSLSIRNRFLFTGLNYAEEEIVI